MRDLISSTVSFLVAATWISSATSQRLEHNGKPAHLKWIAPGGEWLDTRGQTVSAHAGGMAKEGDIWYWVGQAEYTGAPLNAGFNIYSSSDLVTWTFEGNALAPVEGDPVIGPGSVAERPKLIYSESLKHYGGSTWTQYSADSATYGALNQAVGLSPNITGPYKLVSAFKPLGGDSQDFGLFLDDDGQAYALYSNGDSVAGRDNKVSKLNMDRTNLTETVYTFTDIDLEAPTIVRTDESYYMLMSHKTGYRANDVVAYRARHLSGPWSSPYPIAPLGTRTFYSQSTFNIRVEGSEATTHIYIGDSWDLADQLEYSRYMFLPSIIDESRGTFKLSWHDLWAIDVKTGKWYTADGIGDTYYAAEQEMTGGALIQECPSCDSGKIVTGISGLNSTVTFTHIPGDGADHWVSFYYINADDMGFGNNAGGSPDRIGGTWAIRRTASVSVNGATPVQLRQKDSNKGVTLSVPLRVTLQEGNNTITVGGFNGGKAADLEKIIVYDD